MTDAMFVSNSLTQNFVTSYFYYSPWAICCFWSRLGSAAWIFCLGRTMILQKGLLKMSSIILFDRKLQVDRVDPSGGEDGEFRGKEPEILPSGGYSLGESRCRAWKIPLRVAFKWKVIFLTRVYTWHGHFPLGWRERGFFFFSLSENEAFF